MINKKDLRFGNPVLFFCRHSVVLCIVCLGLLSLYQNVVVIALVFFSVCVSAHLTPDLWSMGNFLFNIYFCALLCRVGAWLVCATLAWLVRANSLNEYSWFFLIIITAKVKCRFSNINTIIISYHFYHFLNFDSL